MIIIILHNHYRIIEANGGLPPNTFNLLNNVCDGLGHPPRPVEDPDFSGIKLMVVDDFDKHFRIKTLEEMGTLWKHLLRYRNNRHNIHWFISVGHSVKLS